MISWYAGDGDTRDLWGTSNGTPALAISTVTAHYTDLHNYLSLEAGFARRCDLRRKPAGKARL